MAKSVVVTWQGTTSSFAPTRLERRALYGARRRIAVDEQGRTCSRAALTDDGAVLLRAGMTALGWVDAHGHPVEHAELGAVDDVGTPLPSVPATLGVPQPLQPATALQLLDLAPTATYALAAEDVDEALVSALADGALFSFAFNARADHRAETAFLVGNDAGVFAIVGVPAPAVPQAPTQAAPVDDDEDGDELDFEMF